MKTKFQFLFLALLLTGTFVKGQVDASFQTDTLQLNFYSVKFVSSYSLADTLNFTFHWDFGDGEQSSLPVVKHLFEKAGKYFVRFSVSDGSNSDQSARYVIIHNRFEIPNVFTPNDDGRNDFLVIKTNGKDLYSLSIFSPSGSLVFKKTAYNFAWDGRSPQGYKVATGVYYYTVTLEGKYVASGFFHLIR